MPAKRGNGSKENTWDTGTSSSSCGESRMERNSQVLQQAKKINDQEETKQLGRQRRCHEEVICEEFHWEEMAEWRRH